MSIRRGDLYDMAVAYAAELDTVPLTEVHEWISELAVECPFWDERTNLLELTADGDPTDLGVVLCDGVTELIIRFDGSGWIVDDEPVDWAELEERLFDED
jgi:hypothetical protein